MIFVFADMSGIGFCENVLLIIGARHGIERDSNGTELVGFLYISLESVASHGRDQGLDAECSIDSGSTGRNGEDRYSNETELRGLIKFVLFSLQ